MNSPRSIAYERSVVGHSPPLAPALGRQLNTPHPPHRATLGVVSSYSSVGKLNWQVRKAPKWGDGFKGYLVRLPQDQEVLVSGEHNLMLLSASGHLRAEAQMPQPPRRRPILGDFDGDGAADVLVVSDDAIWGFSLQYGQFGSSATFHEAPPRPTPAHPRSQPTLSPLPCDQCRGAAGRSGS